MELFDKETIYGIVADGKYNRKKAAILQGQPLTAEQREWWDEAEILRDAENDRRDERADMLDRMVSGEDGPMSGAERVRKHMMLKASVDDVLDDALTRIDWGRRKLAEASLLDFVKIYGCDEGAFLEEPPAQLMESILTEMQTAVDDSSVPYHIRVARGHGKTSYAKLAAAWAAATGKRRFIVVVGSNAGNAQGIVNDILGFFTNSPLFAQDFPEISVPLSALNGVYQRAKAQTYRGRPTCIKIGMGQVELPVIEGSKSSGCIMRSVGFATSARGMVKGKRRPDLLILDDLQSDDLAGNEDRVLSAVQHIKKTFLGLAGHRRKIAAVMTSTPIEVDDLSETFARDPSWKTTTHRMVVKWPSCFGKDGAGVDYWTQYSDILFSEIASGSAAPHLKANLFYAEHRADMDAGAVVLNPSNFDENTEMSGIQHAMNILFRDGRTAFMSEYQMEPVRHSFAFEISSKLILSRIRPGVRPCTIPEGSVLTVAATDINPSYGITTAVTSFDVNLTGLVVAYKVFRVEIDARLNDLVFNARLASALTAHAREIAALGLRIDRWGIDAGGRQFRAVTTFTPNCQGLFGLNAVAMLGRAGQNWNPNVRSRIRAASNNTVLCHDERGAKWIAFNADYYKEKAQKAWGTEVGGEGGLSIFDGGVNHAKFAVQIANERLVEKKKIANPRGAGEDLFAYRWKTKEPHDFGDCMAMCYALAGASNLTGDGAKRITKHRRSTYG